MGDEDFETKVTCYKKDDGKYYCTIRKEDKFATVIVVRRNGFKYEDVLDSNGIPEDSAVKLAEDYLRKYGVE
jgi:hypothetical protein